MNAPAVKGWCPGALRPMESGDGLIVRLKLTGGIVPLGLAARIAEWSNRWGNGQIDLTARANLQLRGVTADGLPELQDAIATAGLLDADPDGEAVRNVIASPLAGLDPDAVLDIRPIVAALEARLAGDPALHALPAKFCFAVDDGGRLSLTDVRADVRFEAIATDAGPAFAVGLDGADDRFGPIAPDRLVDTAVALAKAFLAGQAKRMGELVAQFGAAEIAHTLAPTGRGWRVAPGEGVVPQPQCLGLAALAPPHPPIAARWAPPSPRGGEGILAPLAFLGVGLPFGRIAAEELTFLANSAAKSGATEIRLTPWRAILIPLPSAGAAKALSEELAQTGLILDPADPRRRVAACVGAPACFNATTDVRADATQLAATVGEGQFLHVSGCAKGCAHPRPAAVTLVGRDGHYDFVLGGGPSDSPSIPALMLDEVARHLRQIMADQPQGGTA